jgi:hypothetical protein
MSSSIVLPSCAWLMPIGMRAACCWAVARCWPPLLRWGAGAGAAAAKASSDNETSLYMVKKGIDGKIRVEKRAGREEVNWSTMVGRCEWRAAQQYSSKLVGEGRAYTGHHGSCSPSSCLVAPYYRWVCGGCVNQTCASSQVLPLWVSRLRDAHLSMTAAVFVR